jgi:crotonobetainyl-CoA:carnitine CoA-transferase CaiB-like acyl-CoA transferase
LQAFCEIRVLEIGRGFDVAGLCGQLLIGVGATVMVVETESGASLRRLGPVLEDGSSYLLQLLHAGKLTRLKVDGDVDDASLDELIGWADIVLYDAGGLQLCVKMPGAADFSRRWPDKILCSISLYGARSTRPHWVGNELIAEAASGLMSCNGYPERPPVTSGLPYALHTTALFAFNAVVTALWERDRSGRGQTIDLAIIDCIVSILGNFLPSYFLSGKSPKRIGNRHTIAAPWNLYPAADGSVVICTGTGGTGWWAKVMTVLGRPELSNDPRYVTEADRVRNVEEVDALVSQWTAQRSMKLIVEQMTEQGIPVSEISTLEAVLGDPHFCDLRAMIVASPWRTANGRPLPKVGNPLKVGDWQTIASVSPTAAKQGHRESSVTFRGAGEPRGDGALSGVRVLEFASRTSAPLASRLMADFGAEVIKIEPRKGDALRGAGQRVGDSSYLFHINNAGKCSVVIEPTDPRGRQLILDLAAHADVFIENLAPGSLAKMGLGYAELQAVNPKLIYCSVNGFGERSSYGKKRALDTVVQAACGLMHMTGYPDHFPVKLGISAIDLTTAAAVMAAVQAALRERVATGAGSSIDLAMADVGVWMTQKSWPQMLCENRHPIRLGNRSPEHCPHGIFPTRDDRFVAIAVETTTQWRTLVGLLQRPELAAALFRDPIYRLTRIDEIERLVSQWTLQQNAEGAAELCQSHGIPASVVRELAELVNDPDVLARGMIVDVAHPTVGNIRVLGNPLALSRTPPVIANGAPVLGQHTRKVLTDWLDLSNQEIDALAAAGTVITARSTARSDAACGVINS